MRILHLFGELKLEKNFLTATRLFQKLFSANEIKEVTAIEFEYSPGRGDKNYLGDRTAFDVFISYKTDLEENHFIGIEVKYAENMRIKIASHKKTYDDVSENFGIFKKEKMDEYPTVFFCVCFQFVILRRSPKDPRSLTIKEILRFAQNDKQIILVCP